MNMNSKGKALPSSGVGGLTRVISALALMATAATVPSQAEDFPPAFLKDNPLGYNRLNDSLVRNNVNAYSGSAGRLPMRPM